MRGLRPLLVLLLPLLLAAGPPAGPRPHVYVVVIDGLSSRLATRERMPALFAVLESETGRSSFFPRARGVMPARSNPNFASLLTGTYPQAHGITGNAHWRRGPRAPIEKLDSAELLEVQSLFTVAEQARPELITFAAFAKPKLARLFAGVPERQRPPDTLWAPSWAPESARDPVTGYTGDADTMTAALKAMARDEPDLAVVGLADVDKMGHAHGGESAEYTLAVSEADRAVGRLVEHLRALGRWQRSVLMVTSDHGFSSLSAPEPVIALERRFETEGVRGVRFAADGGVGHIYAEGLARDAEALGQRAGGLEHAATIARATPGVAEVLARLPVAGVPLLAATHPDWRLAHERVGELLLVAAAGYQFADPSDPVASGLRGNHGAPADLEVPLFVTGGSPVLAAAASDAAAPGLVDVAPTIASLLGLPLPRRTDGEPVAGDLLGRRIEGVVATRRDQSPH